MAGKRPNSRHKTVLRISENELKDLKVEVGVPVNTGKGMAGMSKWQPVFDKLSEVDTSLAFPIEWKTAIAADATKRNMAAKKTAGLPTYRVAIVSETQARIWRVA